MSSTQKPTDSTDNKQPMPTAQNSGMTRRDLLRRSAVGGATLAGVSTGAIRLDHGPVQESQAIAPAVVAGGVGASAAAGWLLREAEILGSDAPPEGLTAGAAQSQVVQTARTRKSTNSDTLTDNDNLVDAIENPAWADGKLAAIDALNEQKSETDVLQDAHNALYDYISTVQENYIETWNESVRELETMYNMLEEHEDIEYLDVIHPMADNSDFHPPYIEFQTNSYELADGSEIDLMRMNMERDAGDREQERSVSYDPTSRSNSSGIDQDDPDGSVRIVPSEADSFLYLKYEDWSGTIDQIESLYTDIADGLSTWVTEVYSDVQSGEISTDELLTPREQAELTSEDEDFPQAIADLQALNVSVDLEREAEIHLPEINATLYGQLAYTGDGTLEVGTIDPDETDDDDEPVYPGSIYFNYDVSQGQGEWDAYEDGIDGGTLTFTSEPFEETIYYVDTAAGETAELTTDELTEDDDEWTIDLSDQLENQITEVDQIEYYADTEGTQYETTHLQEPFEIVRFTDSDGNEYEETDFERSEPQTADNYITQEEWEEQQERHEELIQQYEDAQSSGISIPGVDDVLDGEANGLIGIAVVGLVFVFGILSALNPLS